jgi:hypothetical protein
LPTFQRNPLEARPGAIAANGTRKESMFAGRIGMSAFPVEGVKLLRTTFHHQDTKAPRKTGSVEKQTASSCSLPSLPAFLGVFVPWSLIF